MTEETDAPKKRGLHFVVFDMHEGFEDLKPSWKWKLVGAEGVVAAVSPGRFPDESAARKHLAENKGRMSACKRAKVITE